MPTAYERGYADGLQAATAVCGLRERGWATGPDFGLHEITRTREAHACGEAIRTLPVPPDPAEEVTK